MRPSPWIVRLYALTSALLIAHEIDSAFWREWELFRLGDEPFFVLVHVPVVIAVLWGYGELAAGRASGYRMAAVVALIGFGALFIHGGFLMSGSPEFRTPVSLALIGVMAAASLALGVMVAPRLIRPPADAAKA